MPTPSIVRVSAAQVWRSRKRPARILRAIAVASFVAAELLPALASLVLVGDRWRDTLETLAGTPLLVGTLAALAGIITSLGGTARRGSLAVDGDKIVLEQNGREQTFARADVVGGCVVPVWTPPHVELRMANGDSLKAAITDLTAGQRVLEAAGVDPSRRTFQMTLEPPAAVFSGQPAGRLVIGAALLYAVTNALVHALTPTGPLANALAGGLWLALGAAALVALRPPEITVGADGLLVRRGRARRFVAFADVARVDTQAPDMTLVLRDGSAVALRTRSLGVERREVLARRILDAMKGAPHDADLSARLAWLDRGGRALDTWRAEVAALLQRSGTYRLAALSRDDVASVLDDPRAPPERRVAAAMALADDPQVAPRIRVAAAACVNEPVRVALEQIAEGGLSEAAIDAVAPRDAAAAAAAGRRG